MTRLVARLLWGSTLLVPLLFAWVAETVRAGAGHLEHSSVVFWLAVASSAVCIALSRAVPDRLRPLPAGREATALLRMITAWAFCEGAALFPLVAWIVTDDSRLLGVCAVDLVALLTLYPSEARWNGLLPGEPPPARR